MTPSSKEAQWTREKMKDQGKPNGQRKHDGQREMMAKGMLMDMKKRVQPKAGHVPINLI